MSYGGESFGVRPFSIAAPIVLGACLIMLFSTNEDISEKKKNSCRQHLYVRGVALCCVLEQDNFFPCFSTGSTQEDPSRYIRKIVDWEVKNQIKQNQGRS